MKWKLFRKWWITNYWPLKKFFFNTNRGFSYLLTYLLYHDWVMLGSRAFLVFYFILGVFSELMFVPFLFNRLLCNGRDSFETYQYMWESRRFVVFATPVINRFSLLLYWTIIIVTKVPFFRVCFAVLHDGSYITSKIVLITLIRLLHYKFLIVLISPH